MGPAGRDEWYTWELNGDLRTSAWEAWTNAGRTDLASRDWFTWKGELLLSDGSDWDGDGEDDQVRHRYYDSRGRLEALEVEAYWDAPDLLVKGPWLWESYFYNDLGQLTQVHADLHVDGMLDSITYVSWRDGRRVRQERVELATNTTDLITWNYPKPPPDPDHVEFAHGEDGSIYQVTRTHDDLERLIMEETVFDTSWWSAWWTEQYGWDAEGRPTWYERVSENRTETTFWHYDDRGLEAERVTQTDEGQDGMVDSSSTRTWRWSCP